MMTIFISKVLLILCVTGFAAISDVSAMNGPDYKPPFETEQVKQLDAELSIKSFLDLKNGNKPAESASLVVGNKRVSVREFSQNLMHTQRDNSVSILIDEEPVFQFIFAGNYHNAEKKSISYAQIYQPENTFFKTEKASKSIKWSNRYPLPEGKETEFSYMLKSLGNSQIELSWDIGCTEEQIIQYKQQGIQIGNSLVYFVIPGTLRQNGFEVNGQRIESKTEDELKKNEGKQLVVWTGKLEKLVYCPGSPLNSFSLLCPDGINGVSSEIYHYRRIDLSFQMNLSEPRGKMIIDLGEVAVKNVDTPPAVEGNDLWKQDALHLPLSPTRNLFPNPSFEQGLRYWRWWGGGAYYTRSDVKRYEIDVENGLFGNNALVINPTQRSSAPLRSFSLPGQKGKAYTVSFYAKAQKPGASLKLAPASSKTGGQFDRRDTTSFKDEILTSDWSRYSYSFVSDGAPIALILMANESGGKIWLDGIQYEAGDKATEFVIAPLEGRLNTSDSDNNVEYGNKLNAEFQVAGKAGSAGTVDFTLMNFYKNKLWENSLSMKAGERIELPFDSLDLATGTYILRVRYSVNETALYYDFYRFTLVKSLSGTHATKDLFGTLFSARDHRTEDRLDLMQRLGYGGSTSYGPGKLADPMLYELREKYNVTGYFHEVISSPHLTAEQKRQRHPDVLFGMSIDTRLWRTPKERQEINVLEYYSQEVLDRMENLAEKVARECPYVRVWGVSTEEEGTIPCLKIRHDFDEYAKLQMAFYRGIKRGNPNAWVVPSGGTSGYGKIRGKSDIEGYLTATQGKVKWDAIAVHPYGSIDGTLGANDLDESFQMLSDSIAEYGYGSDTPILFNEGGGSPPTLWGDGPDYSYSGGQPSYDQGLHEFLHASKMARQYIICLKYWPRLPHFNTWQPDNNIVVDVNLTPTSFMHGINTLGHLFAKPEFVSDIRPAAGMRGYAFKDEKGNGVAALWCTNDNVERGFIRGPIMRVQFDGELPELIDLMGKSYPLKSESDGYVEFQLTPAPFFLRGGDPQKLANALKKAEVIGAGASVTVAFQPSVNGAITANVTNLTGREQTGKLVIDGKDIPFQVAGNKTEAVMLPGKINPVFGLMQHWKTSFRLEQPKTSPLLQKLNMDYFYVPHISSTPDWDTVPGFKMDNLYRPSIDLKQTPGGHQGDIAATFKLAWDSRNLYLRVEAEDDIFNVDNPQFWNSSAAQESQLYLLDGCLEVYFDCGANGKLGNGGYDLDDYRYDFCTGSPQGKNGPGRVYRLQEVFMEYGGGVEFPSKREAAKGIKCEFTRVSDKKYVYNITFAQKYLEPLRLQKGSMAGFGLYLHDRMDDGTLGNKGLSLATEPGSHCNLKPQVWPLMILSN